MGSRYRPEIDGLRAVAVLAVLAFHAFPARFSGGFLGVDVFFVISGYLISTILFESLEKGTFRFSEFYARRIRRIFPALALVLGVCLLLGWRVLLADEFQQLGEHVAAGAGFVSNFVLWNEVGYFDRSAGTKPLLHLWSLGVEEQFYLFWPPLLWFARRRGFSFPATTIVVASFSFALFLLGLFTDSSGVFYSPQTRIWELLCGGLLAWARLKRGESPGRRWAELSAWLGVALLSAVFLGAGRLGALPGSATILAVAAAVLLLSAGSRAWVNRVLLSRSPVVWIGLISFPLYLWHWPLLSFARIVEGGVPGWEMRLAALALSFVLAWLTYIGVERPVRFGGGGRARVAGPAIVLALVGLAGFGTWRERGFGSRAVLEKSTAIRELAPPFPHEPFRNGECESRYPEFARFDACLLSKAAAPEVLLLGDSHSNQYFKSLAARLPEKTVMNLALWGCLPFSSRAHLAKADCEARLGRAIRFAAGEESIKTIYLAGYWGYLASGGFSVENENFRRPRPLTPGDSDSFSAAGRGVLGALLRSGKRVVLLLDIPDMDFNIRSCFESRPFSFTKKEVREPCGIRRRDYELRNAPYLSLLQSLAADFPALEIYSPLGLLCGPDHCLASKEGRPLYYNSDHLTLFGTDLVVDELLRTHPAR